MTNRKTTKRALLGSVLALVLCFAMLLGSTYAWFTDHDTIGVNKIVAGELDVTLVKADGSAFAADDKLIFTNKDEETDFYWEPGASYATTAFKVKNDGNLALKFQLQINKDGVTDTAGLLEVLDFKLVKAPYNARNPQDTDIIDIMSGSQTSKSIAVDADSEETYQLVATMKTDAGNEYMNAELEGITITVIATQDTVEVDSIDKNYDADATWETEAREVE